MAFTSFVADVEPRLRRALVSALGLDRGVEATAEALAWAWEHWDQVRTMGNPAGYLYRVGRTRSRRHKSGRVQMPDVVGTSPPWVEPGLPAALASLSEAQRASVMLVHTFGFSLAETAEMLGVAKSTVQTHLERGLRHLRDDLGVNR